MSAKEVAQWVHKDAPSWEICGVLTTRLALRMLPLLFSGEPRLGYGMWYQNMVGSTFRSMAIAHFASMSEKNIVLSLSDKAIRDLGRHKTEAHTKLDREMESFALAEAKRVHGDYDASYVREFMETRGKARWNFDPHGVIFSSTRFYLSYAVDCFAHSRGDGGRKYTGESHAQVLFRDLQGDVERQIERTIFALVSAGNDVSNDPSLVTSTFHSELSSEIDNLRSSRLSPQEINKLPLWQNEMPSIISRCWQDRTRGLNESDGWEVWFDWFERRLKGGELNPGHEKIYARIPIELWAQPPTEMNKHLRASLKVPPRSTLPV
jgi:hypothetical protein